MTHERLAFVDVETTGLGHGLNRIAEIGVVTVDGAHVVEWEALLDPGRRVESPAHEFGGEPGYFCADRASELPRFRNIAADLAARLDGRLLVAHNARFDYAFIKAELERAGIAFAPRVLCTVMLSRKLYPRHRRHDLDALIERHGLDAGERHRALPDARALFRFWQALHREFSAGHVGAAIDELLREPLLPAHLDPDMIDALPERAGVFSLHGAGDRPLLIGRAANLRRHVKRYFHLDRHCARADAIAAELSRIRWQVASGPLDAQLREIALKEELFGGDDSSRPPAFSIRVDPVTTPLASIVPLGTAEALDSGESYGLYTSSRKAANALRRLASANNVCHRLLEIEDARGCPCPDCAGERLADRAAPLHRARHLMRLVAALSPLRLARWPYAGPIAVREGKSVHVFDHWEFLGTVRTGSDLHALLDVRRDGFDPRIYRMLARALPRLGARAVREIPRQVAA